MTTAKWCFPMTVCVPGTSELREIAVYLHENGAIFGIESSFVEQGAEDDPDDDLVCYVGDPFNFNTKVKLTEE